MKTYEKPPFVAPISISTEAQEYFRASFRVEDLDNLHYPMPEDREGWIEHNQRALFDREEYNRELLERYEPDVIRRTINGVVVADIRPSNWSDRSKAIVYTHGGGFVCGSAFDALDSTLPIAAETGLRIISVDYTLAPFARFPQITDEVVRVLQGLRSEGFGPDDIAVLGDSAGGGLAASSVLKFRNSCGSSIAALALWSPWCDLHGTGDSWTHLAQAEPFYTYRDHLSKAAAAYVGDYEIDEYASALLGDFDRGFPPTLIQVGTRELLLSDSVRLYQRLLQSGQDVSLDVYEGMWHVFQFKSINLPEAKAARVRTAEFLMRNLGIGV